MTRRRCAYTAPTGCSNGAALDYFRVSIPCGIAPLNATFPTLTQRIFKKGVDPLLTVLTLLLPHTLENIMDTIINVSFELDLGYFDPEINEEDAAFIKALTDLDVDELKGQDNLEDCIIYLNCDAYIDAHVPAVLTADPGDSSPAEGGYAELEQVEVVKDGKLVDFDVPLPYWLTEKIEEHCYEEWEKGDL